MELTVAEAAYYLARGCMFIRREEDLLALPGGDTIQRIGKMDPAEASDQIESLLPRLSRFPLEVLGASGYEGSGATAAIELDMLWTWTRALICLVWHLRKHTLFPDEEFPPPDPKASFTKAVEYLRTAWNEAKSSQ